MINPITASRRHYEDLAVGEVIDLGHTRVSKDMILDFAREFDPFPFHLDEDVAKASLLGGLASSGWQTGALSLRMLVDSFLSTIASAGGLGFSDLKLKNPVMAGDTIGGTVTIVQLRRSATHRQWGIVTLDFDIRNQHEKPVLTMRLANLVDTRDPNGKDVGPHAGDDSAAHPQGHHHSKGEGSSDGTGGNSSNDAGSSSDGGGGGGD